MRLVLLTAALAAPLATAAAQSTLERAQRDEVANMPDDHPAMQRAFVRARTSLDEFLFVASSPPPGTLAFALKVRVREGDVTEYFWVSPFRRSGDGFSGRLGNTPRLVSTVREGETLSFSRSDIVDWMYIDGRYMRGNFTACALLEVEPADQRAAFQRHFGLSCD